MKKDVTGVRYGAKIISRARGRSYGFDRIDFVVLSHSLEMHG